MRHSKKFVSICLALMLALMPTVTSFADTSGSGQVPNFPQTGLGGGGTSNADYATYKRWGFRITMTTATPITDAGVQPLGETYTLEDLDKNYEDIAAITNTRYWEPGAFGLNLYSSAAMNSRTVHFISDSTAPKISQRPGISTGFTESQPVDNPLAWYIWDTLPGDTRTDTSHPYCEDLHRMILDGNAAGGDPFKWVSDMRAVYNTQPNNMSPVAFIKQLIGNGGENIVRNVSYATWSTREDISTSQDPYIKVMWSKLGHLAMCLQLCWTAQEIGDTDTYNTFVKATASWVSSGFKDDLMPIIMIEATHDFNTSNNTQGFDCFVTLPGTLAVAFPGQGVAEKLFQPWSDAAKGNTTQAIIEASNSGVPSAAGKGALMQGIGGYPSAGAWHNASGSYVPLRNYLKTVSPQSDINNNYGYFVNWTYFSDGIPGERTSSVDPMGSFTWELTPAGVHDRTPDTEISESSTIYNLNIAQSGYNANNYDKWISEVRGDGIDCNKLRVRIYHVSENLPEEQEATDFARDAVRQKGTDVTTAIEKVTVGDGTIQNVPAVGTLKNNEWSRNLSDDEFLSILKTGTGLSYSETVAGKLVNGTTPEGVRVTYAVYVDYDIGCKDTGERYQLANNQAEWVEYRSLPGQYTYISDSPDGYAEIKSGYFDRDKGYYEPWEAMAGTPTTENLYFASGGQDFVAQIKYEYVGPTETEQNPELKNAIRNYEQGYSAETCEGYWKPTTKEFKDATVSEIQSWLDTWTGSIHETGEFINGKTCTQCGTQHTMGVGAESIQSTSITGGVSGSDEPKPGPYYTEINLKATHWNWSGCEKETDDETGKVTCPGGPPAHDSTSGKAPHAQKEEATRYSGTVKSYHVDYNENKGHEKNQASIKFKQTYKDIRYARIKDVHVWRLERSRMEGIRQLTFEADDAIFGEADSYADVVFNVAENDTALEGRMYYMLHPEDGDNFKFKQTLKSRGCCHCYVHNAAEDLIKTNEGMVANDQTPATQLEEGWVVSDYLVLKGSRATASLLYAQYQSHNKDANKYPILNIRVSGTDQASRVDNGYEYMGSDNQWHKVDWNSHKDVFETQTIDYNAAITTGQGGTANANDGTVEKLCENTETFKGGGIDSNDISWGGYNGNYSGTEADTHGVYSSGEMDEVAKYQGRRKVNNWRGDSDKKIFKPGYHHNNQGEVADSGFSTRSPHSWDRPENPFMLVSKPIDVHDTKVINGEKEFSNSTIFYNNIISYTSAGVAGGALWSEEIDPVYNQRGFHVDTAYSDRNSGINNIVIHNPVSAQYAELISLPSELDQRIDDNLVSDILNGDNGKCPGKANSCFYAELQCSYDGGRYHTEDCYHKIRGNGLASVPVTGDVHTELKPVEHTVKEEGTVQFECTKARQTFVAPADGEYTLEVWGAQGGGITGGLGGYSKGTVTLAAGETIYIYVGERGNYAGGWNGGGACGHAPQGERFTGGGGGATDVRRGGTSLKDRIIVAGGGGGGSSLVSSDGKHSSGGGISGDSNNTNKTATQTRGYSLGKGEDSQFTSYSGGGGGYWGGYAGRSDNFNRNGRGGGGSGYIGGVTGGSTVNAQRVGDGLCKITYKIDKSYITYEPVISGSLSYDKSSAEVISTEFKPHIYTAPEDGYYSIHLYGAAGGGNNPEDTTQSSRAGKGGYSAGQVYLKKGQQVLVTVGGEGSSVDKTGVQLSGGYNGGGNSNISSNHTAGHGGGGATDLALTFTHCTGDMLGTTQVGGSMQNGSLVLPDDKSFYWGPRMTTTKDHIYRVDYYGANLDKASFDTFVYKTNGTEYNNCTLLHSFVTSEHVQLFYRVNTSSAENGQEFRVFGNNSGVRLTDVYAVDMDDRILVAGGGGGADNTGGTTLHDNGTGGDGGGIDGEPGLTDGVIGADNGAHATTGWLPGIGQSNTAAHDAGAGGAGWYGGFTGADYNSGGGGGSGKVGDVRRGKTLAGQNSGTGYAIIVLPGRGTADGTLQLSCSEPHHAPNSNWHLFTKGWKHEGGFSCGGVACPWCANGVTLYTPTGYALKSEDRDNLYIIQHDGLLHLTHNPQLDSKTDKCDTCGAYADVDTYSLDGKTQLKCSWKATDYDAACYDTKGSNNPAYHYGFGDDVCYDPCMNDNNHKKHPMKPNDDTDAVKAGKFVILDHDFEIYFPNIGDFYGNGVLGIGNTQKPEGFGFTGGKDNQPPMDTTLWLKEKYVLFPFDVTYKGKTYLAGEKVVLGTYDEATSTWHDDAPANGADAYKYTFHCLLNNSEWAAAKIKYVAVAKNTPVDPVESTLEDHNYTRYNKTKRAYHDAYKDFYVDVVGRIGVLSILDTGDFRFSNYYKQPLSSWKVEQVVHDVDLGKQNFVSVDNNTIFRDKISVDTKGQNTWTHTPWMEPIDKLRPFPLTPGENNIKALRNQAHRIGYSDYMSLVTIGNYYGENDYSSGNRYKVQIQPYYYYYNLETKQWTPMDVYIRADGDSYKMINKYDSKDPTTEYNFYYNLNWETESKRRMYTEDESKVSQAVQKSYFYSTAVDDTQLEQPGTISNVQLPHGIKYLHGTANMLFLRDRNRTFIGSRNRYGINTEHDNRIPEVKFNRQAQRWHFTLGLPSTATFVKQGEPCTPENIAKYDMDKGVIVVALDIKAKGTVWTLGYDGVPVGERSFYLFENNMTKVSWEDAGENGPGSKQVVVVYTDSKTSRNDLSTEGTH